MQMNFLSMDDNHKPRMLKDFLNEKISSNSCSSSNNNGFNSSLPRKPITRTSMRTLIETDLNSNPNYSNPRIWCKTGFSRSAFQTLLNAVKAVPFFTAVKNSSPANENKSTGKMKDIMRWKLCREPVVAAAAEETPSTAAAAAASCSSSGWSESDLSSWECAFEDARNDVVADFEFSLFCFSPLGVGDGEDYVGAATRLAKVENKALICQEQQQLSPISVLQAGEDQFSPPDQSLANNQRKNQTFMQHIQKIESLEKYDNDDDDKEEKEDWVEKSAMKMLNYVKSSTCSMKSTKTNLDKVLLDIFKEELNARRNQTSDDGNFELDVLKLAEDCIYREHDNNKDAYVKDIDWRRKFGKYEEEHEKLALEIETTIFCDLVGEVMGLDC